MSKPDNIYVNLGFYLKKTNITDADVPCTFYSNRTSAIIENAKDYKMSIARLDFDSQNLPILIPSIATGADNPTNNINLTNYQVQIKNPGGNTGTVINLIYTPRNKYRFDNIPVNPGDDTPYYYIFNVETIVDMFNTACQSAISMFPGLQAPFMVYNKDNTFSIYFDEQFATDYVFCMNDELYNLFRNFNYTYTQNHNVNNILIVENRLGTNTYTNNGTTYIIETQYAPSFSTNWSPVSSIVITSQRLPIVAEERIPTVNVISGISNSSNEIEQQISDIVVNIDNPNDYNTRLTYVANTDYRSITLNAGEIREIDLKIYWRSKIGKIYPLLMSDGNSGNCKIKFEKIK